MSASFNSLPVELVAEICQTCRHPSHGPTTLHAQSIDPRRTQSDVKVAQLTHHTVPLPRSPLPPRNWPLLARTLLLRKDLAALVKDLWFPRSRYVDASDPDKFPEEVAKFYLEHYKPRRPYWYPTIDYWNSVCIAEENENLKGEAYVAMDIILSFCSQSVETIYVDLEFGDEAFRLIQAPSALPALKVISFDYINPMAEALPGYIGLAPQLENLIKTAAPTLTTLQLCRLGVDNPIGCVLEKVTHLVICHSYMTPQALDALLSRVPNLEILEYAAEPEPEEDYEDTLDSWRHHQAHFYVNDAFDAIEKNFKKLKSFSLDVSADYDVDWASTSMRESIGNVAREFESKGIKFRMTY